MQYLISFFSKSQPNLIQYTYQEIMLKNDEMTHDFWLMYITTRFFDKKVKLLQKCCGLSYISTLLFRCQQNQFGCLQVNN